MNRTANMIEAAAKAYRACCNGQGTVHRSHKFDCVINFDKQRVEVTDEIGTEIVDMYSTAFRDKVDQLGKEAF